MLLIIAWTYTASHDNLEYLWSRRVTRNRMKVVIVSAMLPWLERRLHTYEHCLCRHNTGGVFPRHGLQRGYDGRLDVSLGRGPAWNFWSSSRDAGRLWLPCLPRCPSCLVLWACRPRQVYRKSRARGQRYDRRRVSICDNLLLPHIASVSTACVTVLPAFIMRSTYISLDASLADGLI